LPPRSGLWAASKADRFFLLQSAREWNPKKKETFLMDVELQKAIKTLQRAGSFSEETILSLHHEMVLEYLAMFELKLVWGGTRHIRYSQLELPDSIASSLEISRAYHTIHNDFIYDTKLDSYPQEYALKVCVKHLSWPDWFQLANYPNRRMISDLAGPLSVRIVNHTSSGLFKETESTQELTKQEISLHQEFRECSNKFVLCCLEPKYAPSDRYPTYLWKSYIHLVGVK